MIAIPEKKGWFADTSGVNEKAYIYLTVAAQLYKQYVKSEISIANVQGSKMLSIALPEALALEFVRAKLGVEALQKVVKKKRDAYVKDRNNDANGEPPLLYADGVDYLEINKGAIVLHEVIDELGMVEFMDVLNRFIQEKQGKNALFQDFYSQIQAQLESETKERIERI